MKPLIYALIICALLLIGSAGCKKDHGCVHCTTDALGNDTLICGPIPSYVHNCK